MAKETISLRDAILLHAMPRAFQQHGTLPIKTHVNATDIWIEVVNAFQGQPGLKLDAEVLPQAIADRLVALKTCPVAVQSFNAVRHFFHHPNFDVPLEHVAPALRA